MLQTLMELDHGRLGILLALVAVLGSMLTVISAIALVQWRKAKEAEIEAHLKMQMLDQGMSATDITAIIDAGRKKKRTWFERHREFHDAHVRR